MDGHEADTDRGEYSESTTDASDGLSRRRFIQSSAVLGAGALAYGASGGASAAVVEETCEEAYGKIQVSDKFKVMDNQWGMSGAQQCVWLNDDGSYGYDFDASNSGGGINYPEAFTGTRPWGDDTGVPEFPLRRSDVDELVMDVDADVNIGGGEWDWAMEWWLLNGPPSSSNPPHQYEIMLLLDWGGGHDHGGVRDRNAWTDQFGNTVSLWTVYNDGGGTSAPFYIFRIEGRHDGGKIDLKPIVDYLDGEGISQNLTISGIELGNEYWSGASGDVTYNRFNVTVNGSTYRSGSDTTSSTPTDPTDTPTDTPTETPDEGDTSPPTTPSSIWRTQKTATSVTVGWNDSIDGGSGVAYYELSADNRTQRVDGSTTEATITGLSPSTTYTVSVVAVDGAGNRSGSTSVSITTDAGTTTTDGNGGDRNGPNWPAGATDPDDDGMYEDLTGNGEIDNQDVVTFFQNMGSDGALARSENKAYYDYSGNNQIDYQDLISLFGEL